MKQLTKALLIISLTAFAIGFGTNVLWGFGMPVGAIFLGLFMISKILEKEMAAFDKEESRRIASADKYESLTHTSKPSRAAAQNNGSRGIMVASSH